MAGDPGLCAHGVGFGLIELQESVAEAVWCGSLFPPQLDQADVSGIFLSIVMGAFEPFDFSPDCRGA